MRWEHPERGELGPAEFIPVAEESGLIGRLGEQVLADACAEASSWRTETGHDLSVHVNLSARQLRGPGLVEGVLEVLDATGLPAPLLHLEITESAVIEDDLAVARLDALRRRGVRVAIDDFGTGYSSLGLLGRITVDSLKIDRSFVERLDGSDPRGELVRAILAIARSLGLGVVAEGVETDDQRRQLEAMGCPLAQGFLFARPLRAAEARGSPSRPRPMTERTAGAGGPGPMCLVRTGTDGRRSLRARAAGGTPRGGPQPRDLPELPAPRASSLRRDGAGIIG